MSVKQIDLAHEPEEAPESAVVSGIAFVVYVFGFTVLAVAPALVIAIWRWAL